MLTFLAQVAVTFTILTVITAVGAFLRGLWRKIAQDE
jgi:hypothetical protein